MLVPLTAWEYCPTCGEGDIKKFDGHHCHTCNTLTSEGFRSQFPLRDEAKEKARVLHAAEVLPGIERNPRPATGLVIRALLNANRAPAES